MTKATLIYNARLLDETMDCPGAVLVEDGKIRAVFQGYFTSPETASTLAHSVLAEDGCEMNSKLDLYDARGLTITPAFIDMHVHLRYPGLTQKEDLNSGLHAAAAGGFGTIVAMPNTKPVVSSMMMAMGIEKEAEQIGLTHLFQTVSITKDFADEDISHLNDLNKTYIPVISEDGKDVLKADVMLSAMKVAGEKDIIVACHCEDESLGKAAKPLRAEGTFESITKANEYLALAEDSATIRNLMLAKEAHCRIHVCHVSTANSIDAIRAAKEEFYSPLMVTCEATPHHIGLSGTDEENIHNIVNPPLRSEEDRMYLIEALRDGTVDVISTDHAPHTEEDKKNGSPGFTGVEVSYAVCNTVLVKDNHFNPRRLSQLMSAAPAKILGLQKGLLRNGYDADLTLIDPDEEWVVDSSMFCSKGKFTPFNGKTLTGKVHALFIDGRKVYER